MSDPFFDVQAQERELRDRYDGRLARLDEAAALGKPLLALRHQPGWAEFERQVGSAIARVQERLVTTRDMHELLRLQGRAQAYLDLAELMADTEGRLKEIAAARQQLQNERDKLVGPDGRATPARSIWSE